MPIPPQFAKSKLPKSLDKMIVPEDMPDDEGVENDCKERLEALVSEYGIDAVRSDLEAIGAEGEGDAAPAEGEEVEPTAGY